MGRVFSCLIILLTFFSCGSNSSGGRKVGMDTNWYPLDFDNRTNNVTAFSTELLGQIGKVEKIPFVRVSVNWDTLMEGLKKGEYEAILTSMPPYIFNEKLFDFSDVYLPLGPVLVVSMGSKIDSLDNLEGKEIAIISGSSSKLILEGSPGVLIRSYDSASQALNDVAEGSMNGAMIDVLSAVAFCNDLYQGKLKIVTPPLSDEGLRLVTKHNAATDLIKGFNRGLEILKKKGTYDALLKKWGLMETLSNTK